MKNRDQAMKKLGFKKKLVSAHYYYTKSGNPEKDGWVVDIFNSDGKINKEEWDFWVGGRIPKELWGNN